MFSSVLCPVDFSEQSARALRHAVALAGRDRGRLTVIHVAHPLLVEAAAAGADVSVVTREIESELRAVVAKAMEGAGAWAPAIDVEVATGDAASDIVEYASDHSITLIVMGTYGLTGYRKMLLGSVTSRVLRTATVPVLVVPQMDREQVTFTPEGPVFALKRVLAPCDFSDRTVADLQVARQMAATFDVPLLLLHVTSDIQGPSRWHDSLAEQSRRHVLEAKARLEELASAVGAGPGAETLVLVGSPAEAIAAAARDHHAGLIVMGVTGKGGLFGPRPGTTAYRVLSMATAPVLALPR